MFNFFFFFAPQADEQSYQRYRDILNADMMLHFTWLLVVEMHFGVAFELT